MKNDFGLLISDLGKLFSLKKLEAKIR